MIGVPGGSVGKQLRLKIEQAMLDFQDLLTKKVKLEFGNQDQIKAIDNRIAWIKEQEELSTYRVTYTVSGEVSVEVRAYDEDDAQEQADDLISEEDPELDYDHLDTEEIE